MAVRLKLAAKKLLAIDWDARDARVVLFRPRAEGIELLKAVSIPIQPGLSMAEPEAFGAFLRAAISQARMNVKHALVTIPRDRVVLNNLRLPPTPVEELPSMVNFQIGKELPFPVEQATVDFAVQGVTDPKAPVDALVAAVRNEDVEAYRKVAYEAGLTLDSMGLRPHGNVVAVMAGEAATGTTLVVEVGPVLTEIDIVRDGVLTFSRAASVGVGPVGGMANGERIDDSRIMSFPVQDRAPDEATSKAVGSVLLEVVRSYEAHRATDPTARVNRVVVAGSTGIEIELAQALGGRFAVRAELYSAEKALGLSAQRARELRGFSAVLGLAMSHANRGAQHFDFLHPKKTVTKKQRQLAKAPIAAAVALLFVGSGATAYWKVVSPKVKAAATEKANLAVLKKKYDALVNYDKKVKAVEQWRTDEQYWSEVLLNLTKAFPPDKDVFVTRLVFTTRLAPRTAERSQAVSINLRTSSSRVVNLLAEKLKEAGFLDVLPGRTSETTGQGGFIYDASITATVPPRKPPAEEESNVSDNADATPGKETGVKSPATLPAVTSGPAGTNGASASEPSAGRATPTPPVHNGAPAKDAPANHEPAKAAAATSGPAADAKGGR